MSEALGCLISFGSDIFSDPRADEPADVFRVLRFPQQMIGVIEGDETFRVTGCIEEAGGVFNADDCIHGGMQNKECAPHRTYGFGEVVPL